MPEIIPGINIQWPWSTLIATGQKKVETRSYKLPEKFRGMKIAIIETPGPKGKKEAGITSARIIGTVVFSGSFLYQTRTDWLRDSSRHMVEAGDSQFGFNESQEKWGWVVAEVASFENPKPAPLRRGIVFAKDCSI